ncbi:MAG: phosphatidate cytidylyltransferase [Thermoplasmata archaeon]|nr:phosphatidate cytidylyltransferase [Thermoplasmata archaeon]MBE3136661.1 phosphatidate cytidylyltransferase [Thermoplasmata archaeon]MBE3140988.1 phosphatidate cytidylyltransferase [Thermoplasmata archaeon]
MFQSDIVGVAAVYIYVALLIVFTEKVFSKRYPVQSRKFLHIMTGNIAFILPLFETREIMAFVAAGPFILFTFLMSPYSPIKSMRGKTSEAGHGLGLVYYAITWTVLAYAFFDHREIIAMGILAMSYGDGLASVIGIKYGKRKYSIFKDIKSYVGSIAMFVCTFLLLVIALLFYAEPVTTRVAVYLLCMAGVATIVEGVTPLGLDNLSVPFVVALMYWFFLVG